MFVSLREIESRTVKKSGKSTTFVLLFIFIVERLSEKTFKVSLTVAVSQLQASCYCIEVDVILQKQQILLAQKLSLMLLLLLFVKNTAHF